MGSQGKLEYEVKALSTEALPQSGMLIKVEYSSLNYKDALSFSGNKGVTRNFPHTPGIDAVGEIIESDSADFSPGQKVLVVGYDLGMNTAGGFGEYINAPKEWVMPLPVGLTPKQSMAWGTAGFTAALCVEKLINNGLVPDSGPILVSGASGGVGSIAISLLVKLGFNVHALTGKPDQQAFFDGLGVSEIVSLDDFIASPDKPLLKSLYAGAVDVAGGKVLSTMLKVLQYGGSIACCGLVDSMKLETTVLPFILRGNHLLGVDSVELPLNKKCQVWQKIAQQWSLPQLENACQIIGKDELVEALSLVLQGKAQGRYILDHNL